jgi:hypothetical protein
MGHVVMRRVLLKLLSSSNTIASWFSLFFQVSVQLHLLLVVYVGLASCIFCSFNMAPLEMEDVADRNDTAALNGM